MECRRIVCWCGFNQDGVFRVFVRSPELSSSLIDLSLRREIFPPGADIAMDTSEDNGAVLFIFIIESKQAIKHILVASLSNDSLVLT